MFDENIVDIAGRGELDTPANAITLGLNHEEKFRKFLMYLERIPGMFSVYRAYERLQSAGNTFRGNATFHAHGGLGLGAPSAMLLEIHKAIGDIISASNANSYLAYYTEEVNQHWLEEDGSSPVVQLLSTRLGSLA